MEFIEYSLIVRIYMYSSGGISLSKKRTCILWYSTLFTIVIGAVFVLVAFSEVKKAVLHFEKNSQPEWSAVEQYPFTENEKESDFQGVQNLNNSSALPRILASIDKAQLFLKTGATSEFCFQMPFVTLSKATDKYCWGYSLTTSLHSTKRVENAGDCVIESDNGMLYLPLPKESIDDNIEVVVRYAEKEKQEGKNFIFLEIPINAYGEDRLLLYPDYYEDYSSTMTDHLITSLEEAGVDVISMSKEFYDEGLNSEDIFLRTDHHWLPQSAMRACFSLADKLNKNYGYSVDTQLFDISNYDISYAPNNAFGSLGKKVTRVYAEPERLPILTPKYDSDVTVFISKTNETRTGKIQEVLFNWDALRSKDIYEREWGFYGFDDQALVSIHNNLKQDGKRVLVLRNSFADAMTPYLGNLAENVDIIYLAYFDGSLETFIKETAPDTIVLAYTVRFFQYDVGEKGVNFNFK